MKILSIDTKKYFIVQTDRPRHPYYRRDEDGVWENMFGDSTEPCKTEACELERLYQDFKARGGERE